MATSPNTSTSSGTLTPKKKDESFLEKIGTLARKKKIKEVNELQEEGKNAIESPTSPTLPDIGPEGYQLGEAEERSMIEPHSRENAKLKDLIQVLLDWINDELADHRIIVKDIEEDLFDGQILQKLIEKLANVKVEAPEVTQSEIGQKQKLRVVLDYINRMLQLPPVWNQQKWSVDSVHTKNLVAILHLVVALARHFRAPIRLPENVCVTLLVVQKVDGVLQTRRITEEITSTNDDIGARFERDAFDTLFDHAPDKLNVVKKTLVTFVNKQLMKVNLEVTDLDSQFHDGVYLVMLIGLLEGYFVPLYHFHLTPDTFEQKVHNVTFAFELMQDAGLQKPKARPEDVVNLDLKSTLRVLYNIFTKYKATTSSTSSAVQ
ncbi:beta-parvin-like [Littorina saxatilis]|uniref:Calponin-homology (CH) domain-containing protein n=1 Tax=Littorina saxatilis TaxID=31220 RepID=A0AAN9GH00_9CAEN